MEYINTGTVINGPVRVRSNPVFTKGNIVNIINKGRKLNIIKLSDDNKWVLHDQGGWSLLYDIYSDDALIELDNKEDIKLTDPTPDQPEQPEDTEQPSDEELTDVEPSTVETVEDASSQSDVFSEDDVVNLFSIFTDNNDENMYDADYDEYIKNVRGIFGMPYQFMESVDPRLTDKFDFGRKFAEKFITRLPILILTPGKPKFMDGFSDNDKNNLLKAIGEGAESIIEEFVNGGAAHDGKYYIFDYDINNYYTYVNTMCSLLATYMGISNKTLYGQSLGTFQWETYNNSALTGFLGGSYGGICFYMDAEISTSESFSNSTTQSMLAQNVNSASEIGNEFSFLLGAVGGEGMSKFAEGITDGFSDFSNKWSNFLPSTLMSRLNESFQAVIKGGKIIIPEIWSDSSYDKSYSVNIKLRTPDPNDLSWFIDIGVPLMHLIALTAPRQTGYNSYESPFLIRAYSKAMINIDMGVIGSLNIKRGDKCKWTLSGLPTEIDIDIDLKSLYNSLATTGIHDGANIEWMKNTAMMDYIANSCGLNINAPDVLRSAKLFWDINVAQRVNPVNVIRRQFMKVTQALDSKITQIFT